MDWQIIQVPQSITRLAYAGQIPARSYTTDDGRLDDDFELDEEP